MGFDLLTFRDIIAATDSSYFVTGQNLLTLDVVTFGDNRDWNHVGLVAIPEAQLFWSRLGSFQASFSKSNDLQDFWGSSLFTVHRIPPRLKYIPLG